MIDHIKGERERTEESDPITVAGRLSERWTPCRTAGLPECFTGGWVGYMGYDTVRYQYMNKLPFDDAPEDDRELPDLCLGLYRDVVVFDHATKQLFAVHWVDVTAAVTPTPRSPTERRLASLVKALQPRRRPPFPSVRCPCR